MIDAIHRKDVPYIHQFFERAREYRDSIPNNATGVIRMNYEIFADIPDEAGAIEGVLHILSTAGISIKNLGISHNREDEEGVLRLSFYRIEDASGAAELLRTNGYTIYTIL